ncbi:MAG TPA: FAD-binding protein [Candidatus Atribacteria bacterium]|nr:MAG: oxidoreductase [Candidatus Nealsonbacteria bacterium]HDK26435.1 FAD-binding protein [Candidatus Atribacteria bacterium]
MKKEYISIQGTNLPLYRCHSLIIGSGAASLNCALHLNNYGIKDILIVTESLGGGTSNNSGSDKQTYYKLSLFGEEKDSVYEMANTLFSGGSMHGDIALIEASLSPQEFYHLVQIGVPFPHNIYGGYTGYKTDHDPKQRGISAGPWTSQQMYEKLLIQVQKKKIPILNNHEVIFFLTDKEGEDRRVIGAVAIDKTKASIGIPSTVIFKAENIVMGTGGSGGLYKTSVYPERHLGSTGVALEVGARAVNLTEWQYGLSSIKFRWNVSGSYQQAIPRYISTKSDGSDKKEFLNEYFPTMNKLATSIFLKGYQWPFDAQKIKNYGSSLIDILVYQETVLKGRRVFLDFRKNPSWNNQQQEFNLSKLAPEAYEYLEKSNALLKNPYDRLQQINSMAVDIYLQQGIDLHKEPLEVTVCAQHNNGGLKGNIWWESNLQHLFPIGEANGTHGVYRPGGSALNSGQIGGYRAAEFISQRYNDFSLNKNAFLSKVKLQLSEKLSLMSKILKLVNGTGQDMVSFRKEFQERMTKVAAYIRHPSIIKKAIQEAESQYERINSGKVSLKNREEIVQYFQNKQLCLTQLAVLKSIDAYLSRGGGSRGSYLVLDEEGEQLLVELGDKWKSRPELKELRKFTLEYQFTDGMHQTNWVPVREIPEDNFWFENVWRSFLKKDIYRKE